VEKDHLDDLGVEGRTNWRFIFKEIGWRDAHRIDLAQNREG